MTKQAEALEATGLDDLGEVIVTVSIPRPDGKLIRIKLRTLPQSEAWRIRKLVKWPKPPLVDYKKVDGEAIPIYDHQAESYLTDLREADQQLARYMIAASLLIDLPGTLDEKAEALKEKLGQWAFGYLIGIINQLGQIDQEAVDQAVRSFRSNGHLETARDGSGSSHTRSMVESIAR